MRGLFLLPCTAMSTPHPDTRPRVAFPGEVGAHSEAACARLWPAAEPVPHVDADAVVRAVASSGVDGGVLPVENTIAGAVTASDDALLAAPSLYVVGESVIPIHHCVLAIPGAQLSGVRWVDSHPVALAQCRDFFVRHPWMQPRIALDTASAARTVAMDGDPSRAALASRRAAARYGLAVLAEDVEDRHDNQTRFFAIARRAAHVPFGAAAKTAVAVTTDNVAGALLRVLEPLATHDLTLTRLVARPTGEPWRYRFIFDMAHGGGEARVERVLDAVRATSRSLRVLGTYAVEPVDAPSALIAPVPAGASTDDAVSAIRGAVGVDGDSPEAMASATRTLVAEMTRRNGLCPGDLISAVFTVTPDLTAIFPARAAREAGWHEAPLLCATEVAVPGGLPRCIRVLAHVRRAAGAPPIEHVYLGRAVSLRPDLVSRAMT